MNKVFLDANILLEIILPNRLKREECLKILEKDELFYISTLTCHLILHFSQNFGLDSKKVLEFLDSFLVLDSTAKNYENAKTIWKKSDFEDALQVCCAIENNCNKVVTLDKKFAKKYSELIKIVLV